MSLDLDPRTKLLVTILYAGIVITFEQQAWLLAGLTLPLVATLLVGEGRTFVAWLRLIAVMVLVWFGIAWWAFDLNTAMTAGLRLLTLMSVFFVFFRTTPPEDLGNALVKAGLPYEFGFIMSTALQFVPVISRKARNVIDAQRARGIPLEPGFAALRHYPALFAPLLVQSFELADDLAEAMEARGFGRPGRTFLREYRLRRRDWAVLIVAMCSALGVYFI